jgi:hypothetical protein
MLFLEVVGEEGRGSYCYLLLLRVTICGGVMGKIFVAIKKELEEKLCY